MPGRLNVIADELCRLGQTRQTEWSLLPEVFRLICSRQHEPQVNMFALGSTEVAFFYITGTRPPSMGSGWTQSVLGGSGPLCFPTCSHLGKVVEKLQDYPCNRIILIASVWLNMPWFWDLVTMSSHIPLCLPNLPNLLTPPFNQIIHRNLSNLNLHAQLPEPQLSRSSVSLRHRLRLLRESQPDQSFRQCGPFYVS